MLVHLLRNYQWRLLKDQEIDMQPLITLRPRYGIKMQIKKRELNNLPKNNQNDGNKEKTGCPFH